MAAAWVPVNTLELRRVPMFHVEHVLGVIGDHRDVPRGTSLSSSRPILRCSTWNIGFRTRGALWGRPLGEGTDQGRATVARSTRSAPLPRPAGRGPSRAAQARAPAIGPRDHLVALRPEGDPRLRGVRRHTRPGRAAHRRIGPRRGQHDLAGRHHGRGPPLARNERSRDLPRRARRSPPPGRHSGGQTRRPRAAMSLASEQRARGQGVHHQSRDRRPGPEFRGASTPPLLRRPQRERPAARCLRAPGSPTLGSSSGRTRPHHRGVSPLRVQPAVAITT